jgi:hypothetical protein
MRPQPRGGACQRPCTVTVRNHALEPTEATHRNFVPGSPSSSSLAFAAPSPSVTVTTLPTPEAPSTVPPRKKAFAALVSSFAASSQVRLSPARTKKTSLTASGSSSALTEEDVVDLLWVLAGAAVLHLAAQALGGARHHPGGEDEAGTFGGSLESGQHSLARRSARTGSSSAAYWKCFPRPRGRRRRSLRPP